MLKKKAGAKLSISLKKLIDKSELLASFNFSVAQSLHLTPTRQSILSFIYPMN